MALGPAEVAHGPMLIGTILTVLLYGISITQTYLYWKNFWKKDRPVIKYFVVLLFVADTVHTLFTIMYIYISLIKHFADVEYLATAGSWLFSSEPALAGIIGGMVQGFYGWRVKVLTGSWPLLLLILFCSAASFLMGIATAIGVNIVKAFVEFQKFQAVVIVWLVCASLADVIITSTLVLHLRSHRTGFRQTDSHVDRIIRLTVQTGLITAVWAITDLLVFLLNPTGLHLVFNFPLAKLYTNSLMSSLNSRAGWKFLDTGNNTSSKPAHQSIRGDVVHLSTNGRPEVFVHVEAHEMVDTADKRTDQMYSSSNDSNWNRDGKTEVNSDPSYAV